ncbi:MAG: 50S ribosomal protein L16 [archaeon]
MAKLRKFVAYRRLERPYTRRSKFMKDNFIKASPNLKIVRYEMGDKKKKFYYTLKLLSKRSLQIRHNAIESARQSSNRYLENTLGKNGYYMMINVYPHHILRENPLAAGAGADRMSTGMKMSFGKAIGAAAQIREGQTLFTLSVDKGNLLTARKAMARVYHKLPSSCSIQVSENK